MAKFPVKKSIRINEHQNQILENKSINLSKFVRKKIEEEETNEV